MLTDAYIRRQRWLHREMAITHLNLYAEAMSDGKPNTGVVGRRNGQVGSGQKVSADAMWQMLGAKLPG